MVVVEGANSALIKASTLNSFSDGNKDSKVDSSGIFIYKSTLGDANEGVASFAAVSSNFTIFENSNYYSKALMFFVTNTEAKITLLGGNKIMEVEFFLKQIQIQKIWEQVIKMVELLHYMRKENQLLEIYLVVQIVQLQFI